MADPVLITCTANAWTKVATNVLVGVIRIIDSSPGRYLHTYRDTGGAAPAGTPGEEAVLINGDEIDIASSGGIDVYIYADGAAGRVRVDL